MIESTEVREISALRTDIGEQKWRSAVLESPRCCEKLLGFQNHGAHVIRAPFVLVELNRSAVAALAGAEIYPGPSVFFVPVSLPVPDFPWERMSCV